MGSAPSTTIATNGLDVLLNSFICGARGGKLRAQLATRYPACSADQIEEAVQYACKAFLDEAEGISAPGKVYKWIRKAASRYLNREADRRRREVAVDPVEDGIATIAAEDPGPAEELIAQEDDADLTMLVEEVSSSLSDRRRDVLALYGAGYKRPQIAERLGLTERIVKRDLLEIMDRARATLSRLAGGGCDHGEPLVVRFVCGISTPDESAQAREHLARCGRCEVFSERLIAWREKAGAMLPAPVAEGGGPDVLERLAQNAADGGVAFKQQILDGGAHLKQQAMATYARAAEYAPSLASGRPGTATALVAGCLAFGGGATYCVEQGVDPLGAARGLIASAPEGEPPASPPPASTSPGPIYTPVEPPGSEEPPAVAAEIEEPKPKPTPPPIPADSIEPVHTPYQAAEESAAAGGAVTEETAQVETREPDPVPPGAGPQFGGP